MVLLEKYKILSMYLLVNSHCEALNNWCPDYIFDLFYGTLEMCIQHRTMLVVVNLDCLQEHMPYIWNT